MNEFNKNNAPLSLNKLQQETRARFIDAVRSGTIILKARDRCDCGSDQATQFANIDRFGLPFESYVCENCGLIYSNPVIAPESVATYYENFYHALTYGSHATPNKVLYAKGQGTKIFKLMRDWLSNRELNVLEVGCGSGSVIKEFAEAATEEGYIIRGVGLEYSQQYVDCFDQGPHKILVRHGGLEAVQAEDLPFDVVIMSHVLEHFVEPSKELNRLKSLIRPDALIYIEVPGIFSLKYRYIYDCDYLKYFTNAHIFNFNLTSLTHMLNRGGFRLLWGNEEVESIFTLGEQSVDVSDNARQVKSYIEDLEVNLLFYQSLSTDNLKQRLGMTTLENKMRTFEAKVETLGRRTEGIMAFIDKAKSSLPYRLARKLGKILLKKGA